MQVSDIEREQKQFIKVIGCTLLGCVVFTAFVGTVSRVLNESAEAKLPEKSQPVVEAKVAEPRVAKPKEWNVESKVFKRKFYETLLNALRKKGTHKWDALTISAWKTNSDNTMDGVCFTTTYKRRAYKSNFPGFERDSKDVVNTAAEILRKAKVLEAGWGGTLITCTAEGKRLVEDTSPPFILWNPDFGMSYRRAWQ